MEKHPILSRWQHALATFARWPAAEESRPASPDTTPVDRLQQLVYVSQSAQPWSQPQLVELLEQARQHNQQQGITGLLVHQAGRFVQLLEGPPLAVEGLYARIEQDPRHYAVQCVQQAPSPTRYFADWSMAFVSPATDEFNWLLDYVEARTHRLLLPQIPITEPHLLTLLELLRELP